MFGFARLYPIQRESILSILAGIDTVTILATGGGKSFIFWGVVLLYSLLFNDTSTRTSPSFRPVVIVISPLQDLMQDQVTRLQQVVSAQHDMHATHLSARQDDSSVQAHIRNGTKFNVIYMSPEAALTVHKWIFSSPLYNNRIVALIVDEAHCVPDWGKDFRQHYGALHLLCNKLGCNVPVFACTATLTYPQRPNLVTELELVRPIFMEKSPNRPNIRIEAVLSTIDEDGLQSILEPIISEMKTNWRNTERLLIYTRTKDIGDRMCEILCDGIGSLDPETSDGHLHARHVHGDVFNQDRKDRDVTIANFKNPDGSIKVLIASIALGMGVEIPGLVRMWSIGQPMELSTWIQQVGRVGRQREPSIARLYITKGLRMDPAMARYCTSARAVLDRCTRFYLSSPPVCLRLQIEKHIRAPNADFDQLRDRQPGKTLLEKATSCCPVCNALGIMYHREDPNATGYSFRFTNRIFDD